MIYFLTGFHLRTTIVIIGLHLRMTTRSLMSSTTESVKLFDVLFWRVMMILTNDSTTQANIGLLRTVSYPIRLPCFAQIACNVGNNSFIRGKTKQKMGKRKEKRSTIFSIYEKIVNTKIDGFVTSTLFLFPRFLFTSWNVSTEPLYC